MASYGIPQPDIARVIGCDPKTLRKHYRDELDTGETKANAMVAQNLFRKATGDGRESVTAAIFWLKTRARWSEKIEHEHSGGFTFTDAKSSLDRKLAGIAAAATTTEISGEPD